MNQNQFDVMTDAALRDLDPAANALTEEERDDAAALLARIVATPVEPEIRTRNARRRRVKWLVAPVGALAAGVGGLALLGGGGSAFATWTPTPEPLTGAAATRAGDTCLATDRGTLPGENEAVREASAGMGVVLAEQRGGWVYVALRSATRERFCVMPEGLVGQKDAGELQSEGFMASGGPFDPDSEPTAAPDEVAVTVAMEGSVPTDGLWGFRPDEAWMSIATGLVGSDVVGLTVHAPTGVDVQASIANGHFAAWWPSPLPSSTNDGWSQPWSYTATLADGTTREFTSKE